MPRTYGLSKSRFTSGLQCHKQLWWRVHEPAAPELVPDAAQQVRFDNGTLVGVVARGYVPGGTLIDLPHADYDGKRAATQRAMEAGVPAIYEASFSADGVFVAVDILQREPRGWRVIEVKSGTKLEPHHLPDAAIQVHVLRCAGVRVTGAEVMVLNRACTYPDLSNLFVRHDVMPQVEALLAGIPVEVRAQLSMLAGPLPAVAIGPHCSEPYDCPFAARCWPVLPEHHVSTLYYLRKRAAEFEAMGFNTIHDLPEGLKLNAQAERQRRAVQAGRMQVEGDLAAALAGFEPPLAFLDFETVQFAIPIWNGCHPYDQVAAQFSCHRERPEGGLEHAAWAPSAPGDPRAEIARRVVEACQGARSVVAYNASFEKGCLEALAQAVPAHARGLRDIVARLQDPLPVVRNHVYHPDFCGSFSLKAVLPALVPDLGYGDLEIAEGETASRELMRIVTGEPALPAAECTHLREALLRYCERDTLAMVRLLGRLRELARPG
jgi:predicted RecB family nuclease